MARAKLKSNLKRRIYQVVAFGFSNFYAGNFSNGTIYKGEWKKFCNPGMNCYSCPAATTSCPIGAIQAVGGSINYSFGFYAIGFVLACGVIFGRGICGRFCPFGFLQELIYKVPFKKLRLPRIFTYLKYILLVLFVLIFPATITNAIGAGDPFYCEFICPVGTLEAGIPLISTHPELQAIVGWLFSWKMALLIVTILGCLAIERFFCKTMCPLGAIYALLNKISFYHMQYVPKNCVGCMQCSAVCPMDVDPHIVPNATECVRCGKCVDACGSNALRLCFIDRDVTPAHQESEASISAG